MINNISPKFKLFDDIIINPQYNEYRNFSPFKKGQLYRIIKVDLKSCKYDLCRMNFVISSQTKESYFYLSPPLAASFKFVEDDCMFIIDENYKLIKFIETVS